MPKNTANQYPNISVWENEQWWKEKSIRLLSIMQKKVYSSVAIFVEINFIDLPCI